MKFKRYTHNPPHIFADDAHYFITAATYGKIKYFNTAERKDFLEESIQDIFDKYEWSLTDYVVLDNHYHVKTESCKGAQMTAIFRDIHRTTSHRLKSDGVEKGIRIWWNYWDTLIEDEDDNEFYSYYISLNPVKHGYVEDSSEWKWMRLSEFDYDETRTDRLELYRNLSEKMKNDF